MWNRVQVQLGLAVLIAVAGHALSDDILPSPASPQEIVANLRAYCPAVRKVPDSVDLYLELVGHYQHPGPGILEEMGGDLSGWDLYLFPDSTYYYLEWADIFPLTICDKGYWILDGGFLRLQSDGSILKKDSRPDRNFVPFFVAFRGKLRFSLMGIDSEYGYYLEEATKKGTDSFLLLVCSIEKAADIPINQSDVLKDQLYKDAWRPEVFEPTTGWTPCDPWPSGTRSRSRVPDLHFPFCCETKEGLHL